MSEFVVTRGAQLKKNAQDNFISVIYSAPKRKKVSEDEEDVNKQLNKIVSQQSRKSDEKSEQEKEMKRLRWDVMKFASSGLEGASKHKAKVALAISLGAKPPKNRRRNYKKLLEQRSKEKAAAAEQTEQSGYEESLKKHRKMKKKIHKKDTGLLGIYGKVQKVQKVVI